ncbi:DUF1150 family protein [Celeribacter arenosi]|uniref:DUF1150 family protein n=1 Tax=Celeribacter arenosi TaxID=792649 RepID=A0ABP7K4A6_9RHOB
MNERFPNLPSQGEKIVYVKAVDVEDLPRDVRDQVEGLTQIFSVHSSDGQQLALVANRKLAFDLAREHDYAPVNVH